MIHSDQGCHYTNLKFQDAVKNAELVQSMSRKANCWDNAPQESFFGHMKDEIDISECRTWQDVEAVIADYMDYYQNERCQWNLRKLTPAEYYKYLTTGVDPLENMRQRVRQEDDEEGVSDNEDSMPEQADPNKETE